MKKLLIILSICFLLPPALLSQEHNTVEFEYDDAGNRTLRHTIYLQETIIKTATGDTLQEKMPEESMPADEVSMGEIVIQIFPNPTRGALQVKLTNLEASDQVTYALYALTGQILYTGEIHGTETLLDMHAYQNGSYLLKMVVNAQTTTWTIIKR